MQPETSRGFGLLRSVYDFAIPQWPPKRGNRPDLDRDLGTRLGLGMATFEQSQDHPPAALFDLEAIEPVTLVESRVIEERDLVPPGAVAVERSCTDVDETFFGFAELGSSVVGWIVLGWGRHRIVRGGACGTRGSLTAAGKEEQGRKNVHHFARHVTKTMTGPKRFR